MVPKFAKCVAQMFWMQSTWAVDVEWHVDMVGFQRFVAVKKSILLATLLGITFNSSVGCTLGDSLLHFGSIC